MLSTLGGSERGRVEGREGRQGRRVKVGREREGSESKGG